jgi:hypothetical protein
MIPRIIFAGEVKGTAFGVADIHTIPRTPIVGCPQSTPR